MDPRAARDGRSRAPADLGRGRGRARSSSAAGSASRRWRSGAASCSPPGSPRGSCWASAIAPTPGASSSFDCSEIRLASEDGHTGHRGYVTDLLAVLLEGDDARSAAVYACGPPGDARGGARRSARSGASPASWRWRRPWPAASAPASAAPFPLSSGGYMRLCVDGPVVRGDEIETALVARGRGTTSMDSRVLRPRAPPPRHQRLGHLRRDRGAPGIRRSAARRVPLLGLRLQDDHPRAARRQPTAAPLGDPLGLINSIGLPNKGLDGFLAARPARARRAAGAADRLGDGDEPRRVRASGRGRRRPRGGRGPRAQRLLPERQVRADRRRIARGGALAAAARCGR